MWVGGRGVQSCSVFNLTKMRKLGNSIYELANLKLNEGITRACNNSVYSMNSNINTTN